MWSPSIVDLSRTASAMIIVSLVIAGLYLGRDILIPLTLAGFLSFLLAPAVRWQVNFGIPRTVAAIGGVALIVMILIGSALFLAHQVTSFAQELPKYEITIRDKVRSLADGLRGSGVWQHTSELLQRVTEDVVGGPSQQVPTVPEQRPQQPAPIAALFDYARSTIPTFAALGLTLLFTIFMLLQYHELRDRVARVMGSQEIARSTQALNAAAVDLGRFFLLQVSVNATFGLVIGILLWIIGIPSPAVWGLLAALMRFVPYLGALIAAVLPVIIAGAVDPGWWKFVATAGTFIVADLVVGHFIEPMLFGKRTRLSPFAILFAVVFWTSVWGPLGLLLAVPLTLALVVFGEHIPPLAPLALLLGNSPALKPHERLYYLLSAGDVSQALREAEQHIAENSTQDYLDNIAFPALRLGAEDFRRGVLQREHLTGLEASLIEYSALARELIEVNYDEQAGEAEFERPKISKQVEMRFIAGRGPFDQAATQLIGAVVRHEIGADQGVSLAGGLSALGEIVAQPSAKRPNLIILVSVGGLTPSQLALLVRRAQKDLPEIKLLLGRLGDPDAEVAPEFAHAQSATSAKRLLEIAGVLARDIGVDPSLGLSNPPHSRIAAV